MAAGSIRQAGSKGVRGVTSIVDTKGLRLLSTRMSRLQSTLQPSQQERLVMEIELFNCKRHAGNLRITKRGCGEQWKRARVAAKEEEIYACKACPIGARNAGVSEDRVSALVEAEIVNADKTCIRCENTGRRLLHGAICVSCFNRMAEFVRGRNGKGTLPTKCRPLFKYTAHVNFRDRSADVTAVTESMAQFIALVLRHSPDAEIRWPTVATDVIKPFQRTVSKVIPRPFFLEQEFRTHDPRQL